MNRSWLFLTWTLAVAPIGLAQPPQIQSGGVVNAASYAQPIAPGSIATIFGANLAVTTASASDTPLPYELAGTSVTVNGVKAPLFFVSPGQINIQVPRSLNLTFFLYTPFLPVDVTVTSPHGVSAPATTPVYLVSPALFTIDSAGCGRAAALNVGADGALSLNSPENSAAPGDFISLYGTGFGATGFGAVSPPDGTAANGPSYLQNGPRVVIDGSSAPASYAGKAPGLVGVDQFNVKIPAGTREGCAIPIEVDSFPIGGAAVRISIHSGGGQCVDAAPQSYGQISITTTTTSGTGADGTVGEFRAIFPTDPTPSYSEGSLVLSPVSRTCIGGLSAGAIVLKIAPSGASATVQPSLTPTGVIYQQTLPAGFIGPGQYEISSAGGVTLGGVFSITAPVQILTSLPAGTDIAASSDFVVKWTGGQTGNRVRLTLNSRNGVWNYVRHVEVDALAGSAAISTMCFGHSVSSGGNGISCSFNLPQSGTGQGQVIVEVLPSASAAPVIGAQGVTGTVEALWAYRYVFSGLTITNVFYP
jgi:uncharacterized protein (TIGR03437 family)